ncbi:hypothetical protein ACFV4M_26565 [Kitasatospora indigofera]|uniref:hypothetical protein n=1 Tax=Kitasatospora indigofera TaxID=67307 RepID=UPI0036615340
MQPVQEYYSDFISPSCGKAWLSGIALGNLSVDISTAFELNAGDAAIFYYGNVYLSDAGGTSHQDFGPSGLAERRSWSSHRTVGGLSPSNGRAWIDSSSSYAALIDGAYCYPGPVTVYCGISLQLRLAGGDDGAPAVAGSTPSVPLRGLACRTGSSSSGGGCRGPKVAARTTR